MDLDPDIAVQSVETEAPRGAGMSRNNATTTPRSPQLTRTNGLTTTTTASNIRSQSRSSSVRPESSPVRSSFRQSRASTPSAGSGSRSPSVVSMRNERASTPSLDRKRSVPNLSVRSSTPHQPQFRRASSNLNPATPLRTKAFDRPKMTPASVAKEYFQKELKSHTSSDSKLVVFTHDSCYGHRFSRPRSSKAMLGSIVERPERIHATILGASAAYVRLGQRHKDGQHPPHPDYDPGSRPFSIIKSTRIVPLNHPAVTAVHGTKWMEALQVMCDSADAKLSMGQKEITRPIGHTKDSKGNVLPPLHTGDLYLASESIDALQGCLGGVCDAIDTVFQPDSEAKRAFVCIRPPGHHCSAEMPSGFCWLNNVHVGISYAAMNHGLTHAAIIDFDLHHGDGSQAITWDHNRTANAPVNPKTLPAHKKVPIGYYSVHDINSYPCEYGDDEKVLNASTCLHSAHGQSIWNVHLEHWSTLDHFRNLYQDKYKVLVDKARDFLRLHSEKLRQSGVEPKAAIFLSAGFDASEWEGQGMQRHGVNVPTEFYAKITSDIIDIAAQPDLGVDERVISVLEGGYSDRALTSGVLSHLCGLTHRTSIREVEVSRPGLGIVDLDAVAATGIDHDPEWWHPANLEALEDIVIGNLPKPLIKSEEKTGNSFSSPTAASTAKMTEVAKERKSLSAQMEARLALENAPPEPVPEVDWVIAAYELSRLLIPTERQTLSFTYDELNIETVKVKRERLSMVNPSTSTEPKMQLRDRRAKEPVAPTAQTRVASRTSNRRTTIAAASDLHSASIESTRPRRRSSAASSLMSSFNDMKLTEKDESSTTYSSSRATSAVSTKPVTAPVKKTRAPAKKATSATDAAARKPKASVATAQKSSAGMTISSASANGAPPANSIGDGMDELTSGMKKINIKLKMPTEEQHLANQKRAQQMAATTRTDAARKPAVPKFSKPKASSTGKPAAKSSPGASSASQPVSPSTQPNTERETFKSPSAPEEPHPYGPDLTTHQMPAITEQNVSQPVLENGASAGGLNDKIIYPNIDIKLDSVSPPPTNGA